MLILADHNIEGQAMMMWGIMNAEGWSELVPLRLVTFRQVGLPHESTDREVWHFVQHDIKYFRSDVFPMLH